MLGKYIAYYRLKNNMTQEELAPLLQMSPATLAQYENGNAVPSFAVLEKIAERLDADICDFLAYRNEHLTFVHGEFRKDARLTAIQQDFLRLSVEEYLNRFYIIVEILGEDALPVVPACHGITLSSDAEENAKALRAYFHFPGDGPVKDLVRTLEDKGVLVCFLDFKSDAFSGMNGLVNSRPYIAVNGNMSPERIRSTIVHEMAHFAFQWPCDLENSDIENRATAISGAFLFPKENAKRELGNHRSAVSTDMEIICRDYGISMSLLAKRAYLCGIIGDDAIDAYFSKREKRDWMRNEPVRIAKEEPMLFSRLVFRAVTEYDITIEKGAELLKRSYAYVASQCFPQGE